MADAFHQPAYDGTPEVAARVALIERSILVLIVVGLSIGVLVIVKPFTTAILFGATLATAAWPVRQALVRHGLGRGSAAALLLLLSLVLVVLPMLAVAPHLADQLSRGIQRVQSYFAATPEQPAWIKGAPLVGRRLAAAWDRVVQVQGDLRALAEPYTANLELVMIAAARALADSLVQMILSLAVATMFGPMAMVSLRCCTMRSGGLVGRSPSGRSTLRPGQSAVSPMVWLAPPPSKPSC